MGWGLSVPSLDEAAALLVAASVIEVETDRGTLVELWTISYEGRMVAASGPRLAVGRGMRVRCRVAVESGALAIAGVIEEAVFRSAERAALTIRVTDVARETRRQRGSERFALRSAATLRVLICDRLVPGEVLAVTLVDLAETGCAVTTSDDRVRVGDRVWFSTRFLEGELATELRVARVARNPSSLTIGCRFMPPGPNAAVLDVVLTRLHGPS